MDWNTPIQYMPGVGPIMSKRLEKLGITITGDLLFHIPTRYEDYSKIITVSQLQPDTPTTIIGKLLKFDNVYTKYRKNFQKAVVADETGLVEIIWFNQPFLTTMLKPGIDLAISAKPEFDGKKFKFISPDYEIVRADRGLLHTGRLVPVYPQTEGVSSKWLRLKIAQLLSSAIVQTDYLPDFIRTKSQLVSLTDAANQVHFPKTLDAMRQARKRLAFDELFITQLIAQIRKRQWHQKAQTQAFTLDAGDLESFIGLLPFQLTKSQQTALSEITRDLEKTTAMNRLLRGDVGSGKTVLAAAAAFIAHKNNQKTAIMAPTEILAQQHYKTLNELLKPFNIHIGLLTSSSKLTKTKSQNSNLNSQKKGRSKKLDIKNWNLEFDVVVGTHALLEDKYEIDDLGLVVIDEQHRFGVKQRGKLRQKGKYPHTLTMTATPIPRTIMLTVHGDLDISTLDELPHGRLPIKTRVVPAGKRNEAYTWIRQKILSKTPHEQVFIVCPFIEPSENLTSVKAVKEEHEKLKKIFPDLTLGLLHGKLTSRQKDQILTGFRQGSYDILVCTPVVEVGIDIPNASIMVIEAAERFGLAQLHQLRGRVGRGNQQSFCLLFTSSTHDTESQRLASLERTTSGVELAEFDLKIRGPGSVYGIEQHGRSYFKVASYEDFSLIDQVQKVVAQLLEHDPRLLQYPLLKQRVISSTIADITPD